MDVSLRYMPSFATLFVTLNPGENIIAEAGAMASMSAHTRMRTRFNGGFFRAILRRVFGGESLFLNEFYCAESSEKPASLVLTQPTPGDVCAITLRGNTLCLQPGAFIACTSGIKLRLAWAGFASWFGGEGLFRMEVSGYGQVWMGGYGSIVAQDISHEIRIDTSHLVAYEPTLSLHIALAGGLFSSFFGGEGFVTRVKGQGRLYVQSRSMDTLAHWTNGHI